MTHQHLLFMDGMMRSGARFDTTGTYRYSLERHWGGAGPVLAWVMLNPSTADAAVDDSTVRRCIAFSRAWGYAGLVVVNLFALRATDPVELGLHPDPVGPDNDAAIVAARGDASVVHVVAAWGAHAQAERRARAVLAMLPPVRCLGVCADGAPRHPLYVPAATSLQPYPATRRTPCPTS